MANLISLVEMALNMKGIVVEIQGGQGMIRKLDALGIREGVEIRKISSQLMRGPVMVEVERTQVGIGFGMASRILVEIK